MIEIPIYSSQSAIFTQYITLDSNKLTIQLLFNLRADSWYMNLTTQNGNKMYSIKLVLKNLLLFPYKAWFPDIKGDFVVIPKVPNIVNFSYADLGIKVGLYYLSKEEIISNGAEYGFIGV